MADSFTYLEDCLRKESVGLEVRVRGWVHRRRQSGGLLFIVLRDRTEVMQASVHKDKVSARAWTAAEKADIESSVIVQGVVREDKRAPGGFELGATDVQVIHAGEPFPITEYQSPEFLLDKRHLWIRSRQQTAVMKVKATVLEAIREHFKREGFYEVTPPILTSGAVEGGSTLFELDYFGQKAYLSQSAQLYLEALIFSLEKVYAITPSFRAEKSRTTKHLTEYWHVEPEMAHWTNEDTMRFEEALLSHLCQTVAKRNARELQSLGRDPKELLAVKPPFPRLTYQAALERLNGKGFHLDWGDDFGADEERALTAAETLPLFITNFPRKIKPFYMKVNPEDGETVLNHDVLAPQGFGEIIGGSQREDAIEPIVSRLKTEGLDPKDYAWYLDLRRYGSVPHSGFGLGLERVVRWLCKLEHVRDATPFPRVINRVYP
jgi:asparaginyl-tRNA synthetase